MVSDTDLVNLCAGIYDPSSQWDHLFFGAQDDDIYAGIKKINDTSVLCFRGSVSATDWFRDFMVLPHEPLDHPQLGIVHAGFYEGMDEFFEEVSPLLGPNPFITGHSLGAARAWLFGGLLTAANNNPCRITVFGSPKPGGQQLASLLASVSKGSYRNGEDPVTEVPLWIGYHMAIEPVAFTGLKIEPTDWSEGPMAWHSINLYEKGLTGG